MLGNLLTTFQMISYTTIRTKFNHLGLSSNKGFDGSCFSNVRIFSFSLSYMSCRQLDGYKPFMENIFSR